MKGCPCSPPERGITARILHPNVLLGASCLLTALLLVVHKIADPLLKRDSIFYITYLEKWLETNDFCLFLSQNPEYLKLPPLYFICCRGLVYLLGSVQASCWILNLLCISLLPIPTYYLAREIGLRSGAALTAGLLLTWNPPVFDLGTNCLRDPLFLFLTVCALWMGIRAFVRDKKYALPAGFLLGALPFIRYEGWEVILLSFAAAVFLTCRKTGRREKLFKLALAASGTAIVPAVFLIYFACSASESRWLLVGNMCKYGSFYFNKFL